MRLAFRGDLEITHREFHSAHLGIWLRERGVDFVLRQKKSSYIQQEGTKYQPLKQMGFQPGEAQFFQNISCNKEYQLPSFNLAVRWKRKYRGKQQEQPWYLLTSLSCLQQTLAAYRARWGIETMFKDCKTGGYNLEQTRVNSTRLLSLVLLITLAYASSTLMGYSMQSTPVSVYVTATEKNEQQVEPHHSHFTIGLLTHAWVNAMTLWSGLADDLTRLKPHKSLYFQRGMKALSQLQQQLELPCHV